MEDVSMSAEAVATLVGVIVAAATGIWNLVLLMRGKRDSFILRSGTVSPDIYPQEILSVVSKSDHPIALADWGFIEANGTFSSIPMDAAADPSMNEDLMKTGSIKLAAWGDTFETGYRRRDESIGVFARTVTQTLPRLAFDSNAPLWRRCWIRVRLLFQPYYLTWTPTKRKANRAAAEFDAGPPLG
jgi:hypothetical protein